MAERRPADDQRPRTTDEVVVRIGVGRALLAAVLLVSLPNVLLAQAVTVSCASKPGERQHCPAATSKGVILAKSAGESPCLLGKTWGYDDKGVWVSDGCSAEFVVGQELEEALPKRSRRRSRPRTSRTAGSRSSTATRARSTCGSSRTSAT